MLKSPKLSLSEAKSLKSKISSLRLRVDKKNELTDLRNKVSE
jgi:hypothetical protein